MIRVVFLFCLLWVGGDPGVLIQGQEIKVDELPLMIKPAKTSNRGAVFYLISGDGGWNNFDNTFCEGLAKMGLPVVGLDSKKYFWKLKTPQETAQVLTKIIETYNRKFEKDSFIIAGYSFGADIVPFVVNQFPVETRKKMAKVILMSPDRFGDFEIHLSDMLNMGLSRRKFNVVEELKKMNFVNTYCLFGKEEEIVLKFFRETSTKIIVLPGDHHYNSNYELLDRTLLRIAYNYNR